MAAPILVDAAVNQIAVAPGATEPREVDLPLNDAVRTARDPDEAVTTCLELSRSSSP